MRIKAFTLILATAMLISLTGCNNRQREEVELFNTQTETTIQQYDATVALAQGKEEDIIRGILNSDINPQWTGGDLDYSDATTLMKDNSDPDTKLDILVSYSGFFTGLGANSVTQIIQFNYSGTAYLLEMLWVNGLIENLSLEVRT